MRVFGALSNYCGFSRWGMGMVIELQLISRKENPSPLTHQPIILGTNIEINNYRSFNNCSRFDPCPRV